MFQKKQEHLVLLADGELPFDTPVRLVSEHALSREELAEILPWVYLVDPDHLKPLMARIKPKKRQVTAEPSNQSFFAKCVATIGVGILLLGVDDLVTSGGWGRWLGNMLNVVILVAMLVGTAALAWVGIRAASRLRSARRTRFATTPPLEPDSLLFLGHITKSAPHIPLAHRFGGNFEWEFARPDGTLCGGRQAVPETRIVPGIGRPVIVEYKEPGLYRLL